MTPTQFAGAWFRYLGIGAGPLEDLVTVFRVPTGSDLTDAAHLRTQSGCLCHDVEVSEMWCPTCRSQWWLATDTCPDCAVPLVTELEPEISRNESHVRSVVSDGGHEVASIDVADLDDSERWRIGLLLEERGVTHRWAGATLLVPEDAVGVIEEFRRDHLEAVAPGGAKSSRSSEATVEMRPTDSSPRPGLISRRFAAWTLDAIIVWFATLPIALVWTTTTTRRVGRVLAADGHLLSPGFSSTITKPTLGAIVLSLALISGYFVAGVAVFERTIGKRAFGLRVSRDDGAKTGWMRSVVRYLVPAGGWLASYIPGGPHVTAVVWLFGFLIYIWPLVVFISIAADRQGRGLHDHAAGTIVTYQPGARRVPNSTIR